jgi:hypothetical protein
MGGARCFIAAKVQQCDVLGLNSRQSRGSPKSEKEDSRNTDFRQLRLFLFWC